MRTRQQVIADVAQRLEVAQFELNGIEIKLGAVERDIDMYLTYQAQLVENINILKQDKIIVVAEEYRKAKKELAFARRRLSECYDYRSSLEHALKRARSFLLKCQEAYDITISRYENNLLAGRFRKEDGQR